MRTLPSRHSRSGAIFCAATAQSFVPAQGEPPSDPDRGALRTLLAPPFVTKRWLNPLLAGNAESKVGMLPEESIEKFFFSQNSFSVLLAGSKSTKRSSTAKSSGCRHLRSLSDHERLRFSHDRSGRSRRCRHCFRYFRSAIPQIGGLPKYNFERFALRSKPEERQPAAAPCGGLHRPATGGRRILRRPRTDKGKSYFDCAVDTPPRQNPNKFGSTLGLCTLRKTSFRLDRRRLGKAANFVCFCPRLALSLSA